MLKMQFCTLTNKLWTHTFLHLGRVAQCIKASTLELEGSRFNSHQVVSWALKPNIVTRLTVTFWSKCHLDNDPELVEGQPNTS